MAVFFILLKQELLFFSKNKARFLQNILFFIISCAIFFILQQNQSNQGFEPFINIIWIVLLFSILLSNSEFLREDFRDGTLEQMIIYCENLEVFIFTKIISAWIIFCLPILLIVPLLLMALGLSVNYSLHFVMLAAFASLAINFISAFCGSLNIAGNKAPMIAILTMPLIIPILLIASTAFNGQALEEDSFYLALKILSAICVFSGAIAVVATTKIVKIVSE